jgi:hypothetical protein
VTREEVAIHEAGHVVAYVAFGKWPESVELYEDGDTLGTVRARWIATPPSWVDPPVTDIESLRTAYYLERAACAEGVIAAAGETAAVIHMEQVTGLTWENELTFDTDEPDTDGEHLWHLASQHPKPEAQISWWIDAADAILRSCWPEVEAVAAALLDRGRLAWDDVHDLLDGGTADQLFALWCRSDHAGALRSRPRDAQACSEALAALWLDSDLDEDEPIEITTPAFATST